MAKAKTTNDKDVQQVPQPIIEQTTQQSVDQNTTPDSITNTSNKVAKIIQKRPSHYSLLMSDGTTKVVHKTLFDKSTMTIISD